MEKLLSVENLHVSFLSNQDVFEAVSGVSFDVEKGETLGIVGESGSGKSVTARSIMQLLPPDSSLMTDGKIEFLGEEISSYTESQMEAIRGQKISMIFQDPMTSLNPTIKVGKQIDEILIKHQKFSSKQAKKETIEMLEHVGIKNAEERYSQYPHEFSGGMRQRVMIAMALACEPKLLIADEPTTALDVTIQAQILRLMKKMQKQFGTSIILITHDLGVVAGMCDRVVVMKEGEIVESNTTENIFSAPQHPYTQKLLKALPRLDDKKVPKIPSNLPEDIDLNQPLIEVQNLQQVFPLGAGQTLKAVDSINFTIEPGETLGLVGESGSGKSTTGRLLLQLQNATEGEILYKGMAINRLNKKQMKQLRKEIQIIFQDPFASLNPRMKVLDIIGQSLDIHKLCKTKAERLLRVKELLELVGLEKEHATRYPHEFSGGQRQRIGIARALAVNPKFIVCDEPLSALDVSIQAQIVDLLKDLQKKFGLTYLFIAHDLSMVKHISDRIAVMNSGKIIELADSEELYNNPIHPYTKSLLSAVPVPEPETESKKLLIEVEEQPSFDFKGSMFQEVKEGHWVLVD
ncbi:ABC transporter ATP-binding protein [Virgibacillus profundi]|uniref:ABC transporter ATP-binding protein n=1 Tax=Virgibacillus profundi TaxID=2024555 RepID=A0A2A2I946_9BACI|nr:ABC transporter ATP-binding protein [Virgibacillus profundi]PAV27660.1 ABC transporter ATP-binding protein [Virgibacillus profundi]PXY51990.1 ABC transporter ATP-binding protein [Virgibacillus profundi]